MSAYTPCVGQIRTDQPWAVRSQAPILNLSSESSLLMSDYEGWRQKDFWGRWGNTLKNFRRNRKQEAAAPRPSSAPLPLPRRTRPMTLGREAMNQLSQPHPFRHYQTLSSHAAPSSTGCIGCHLLPRYAVLNTEPEPGNALEQCEPRSFWVTKLPIWRELS